MFILNESLSGTYVHSKPYGTSQGNLRIHLPILMPEIPAGNPKTTPVALNKSCYINALDCKPPIGAKIETQNFITAKAPYNSYRQSHYHFGSSIKVIAKDADCLVCRLAPEDEDNSFNPW